MNFFVKFSQLFKDTYLIKINNFKSIYKKIILTLVCEISKMLAIEIHLSFS